MIPATIQTKINTLDYRQATEFYKFFYHYGLRLQLGVIMARAGRINQNPLTLEEWENNNE